MILGIVFGAIFLTYVAVILAAIWGNPLHWLSCAWRARRASRHIDAEWQNERANFL